MHRAPAQGYENVHIVWLQSKPVMEIHAHSGITPEDGVFIRQLFALMGTQNDETLLRCLPDQLCMPHHPGYTSVGRIEKVGQKCHLFTVGELLLLPVHYQTYITLTGQQLMALASRFLLRLPTYTDATVMTFVPVLSLAIHLFQQSEVQEGARAAILGDSLLSRVFLQVLQRYDVTPLIYLPQTHWRPSSIRWWRAQGAAQIFTQEEDIPPALAGAMDVAYLFSSDPCCLRICHILQNTDKRCISVVRQDAENKHMQAWLKRDAQQEALEWLAEGTLDVNTLVGDHIHAEALEKMYQTICNGSYSYPALIYDW